jgi:hypothetical protein
MEGTEMDKTETLMAQLRERRVKSGQITRAEAREEERIEQARHNEFGARLRVMKKEYR